MRLFRLDQKHYHDFTTPDRVNLMLISAESESQARELAESNEMEFRDGEQLWDEEHATCSEIKLPESQAGVFIVS
ncbi:MAG: hypothetical protein ACXV8O_01500 [Methylobacter sp.]